MSHAVTNTTMRYYAAASGNRVDKERQASDQALAEVIAKRSDARVTR
jgi:hypothetical protein